MPDGDASLLPGLQIMLRNVGLISAAPSGNANTMYVVGTPGDYFASLKPAASSSVRVCFMLIPLLVLPDTTFLVTP
ncbi:hypothetical protein SARI_00742 [Salmonella enterica subsp. arizonae serovar 62:z4,z23:-]|uniref:Uncharacterized protein n=1 Tax=Salmonella arizonae (strain ATCC BAA-731 / CDC346-86 / RSK2980) TaxID=41514 RepID=A9MKU9_SALAR|nr:hypothetical protein SARI_00742 [Salmonella enterica subsp. arizonae serovar 62:z4,z23:-]